MVYLASWLGSALLFGWLVGEIIGRLVAAPGWEWIASALVFVLVLLAGNEMLQIEPWGISFKESDSHVRTGIKPLR